MLSQHDAFVKGIKKHKNVAANAKGPSLKVIGTVLRDPEFAHELRDITRENGLSHWKAMVKKEAAKS